MLISWLFNHLFTSVRASTPLIVLWDVYSVHTMASKCYTGFEGILCDHM